MKIILDVVIDAPDDPSDAREFVAAIKRAAERRINQGFPGTLMNFGEGRVWVCDVEMVGSDYE